MQLLCAAIINLNSHHLLFISRHRCRAAAAGRFNTVHALHHLSSFPQSKIFDAAFVFRCLSTSPLTTLSVSVIIQRWVAAAVAYTQQSKGIKGCVKQEMCKNHFYEVSYVYSYSLNKGSWQFPVR